MILKFEIEPDAEPRRSPWSGVYELEPEPERTCDFHGQDWFPRREGQRRIGFYELGRHSRKPILVLVDESDSNLERTFRELVSQWKEATWSISSIKKRISHPAYLMIIGLGAPAVSLILQELEREPDYWSYALEAIAREDPLPNADNLRQLRDAWLAWGKARGY